MRARSHSPIIKTPALQIEKTEESSLYRQPMSDRQWQRNLAILKTRIGLFDQRLVHEVSGAIRIAYEWLDPIMERYCEITCTTCEDFCCEAAKVFYNQADMLSIIAMAIDPPPGQTRTHPADPCRYLTLDGCSLERTARPYVCVWYLCEAQMGLFQGEPASAQRRFIAAAEGLRANRLKLESYYENHFAVSLR
jgi:hypothetical protein